jgi:hypothetical protein
MTFNILHFLLLKVSSCNFLVTLSYLLLKGIIDVHNDLSMLLRGRGGKVVEVAIFSWKRPY